MRTSPFWLIATPDDIIPKVVDSLRPIIHPGDIIFHCSGALSAEVLQPLRERGASCAAIHPVMIFSDPETASRCFAGTPVVAEGDDRALEHLSSAFGAIGGIWHPLSLSSRTGYHTGMVFASNFLIVLLDLVCGILKRAGVGEPLELVEKLVRATIDDVFRKGTTAALTGPAARGDTDTIRSHVGELESWNSRLAELYTALSQHAVEIAGGTAYRNRSPNGMRGNRSRNRRERKT